jgi:hypothetical protein
MAQTFDVKVFIESFRKAEEVISELKLDTSKIDLQALATTFFVQSMKSISELRKKKNTGGYGQEY